MSKLKYIGDGFLPGVPARDLSADEAEQYGGVKALVATGLYAEDAAPSEHPRAAGKKADKDGE